MIKIYVTIVFILSNPVMVIDVLLHTRRIIRPAARGVRRSAFGARAVSIPRSRVATVAARAAACVSRMTPRAPLKAG